MTISPEFLRSMATGAKLASRPQVIPWPVAGNIAGLVSFSSFEEWQGVILSYRLRPGVPISVNDQFDRALKLYLTAWLDFDLIGAGEVIAFGALEYSLRDCYLGRFAAKHLKKAVDKAAAQKRTPSIKDKFNPNDVSLWELLQCMYKEDNLADDKLPCVQKFGGSVLSRLNGKTKPTLSELRNVRAHGNPFGSSYQSGLLDVMRDLIEYAYREAISAARAPERYHRGNDI